LPAAGTNRQGAWVVSTLSSQVADSKAQLAACGVRRTVKLKRTMRNLVLKEGIMLTTDTLRLHVRFNGRSEDLDLTMLDLRPEASDAELREALARRYDCAVADLSEYVVVRESKAIIVRPIAFYG